MTYMMYIFYNVWTLYQNSYKHIYYVVFTFFIPHPMMYMMYMYNNALNLVLVSE